MNSIHQLELNLIVRLQHLGDWAAFMRRNSDLSSEAVLPLLALTYLGIDRKAGSRLGVAYVLCDWLVRVGKILFHSPRPYWIDPRAQQLGGWDGYGMPSGHVALTFCGWLLL